MPRCSFNNLGSKTYFEQGAILRTATSECYRHALRINPHQAGAYNNLGLRSSSAEGSLPKRPCVIGKLWASTPAMRMPGAIWA